MKKKIAMSLATVGLVSALVGGATFAYFNATVANSSNQFTAGKIQIGQTAALSTKNNIQPGSTGTDTFTLTNADSTLDSKVSAKINISSGSIALADSVSAVVKVGTNTIDLTAFDTSGDGKVSYGELNGKVIPLCDFAAADADKAVSFDWKFEDSGAAQNALQGLDFNAAVTFEAMQK